MDRYPDFLLLNAGFAHHEANWNFRHVSSPFSRIYYVTEGCAELEIAGTRHLLRPAHMYFIPPFTSHSDYCSGTFKHYYIHLFEDSMGADRITENLEFPVEIPATSYDLSLFRRLAESDRSVPLRSPDPRMYDNRNSLVNCVKLSRELPLCERMNTYGIVLQIIARFVGYATPRFCVTDPRVARAIRHIEGNIRADVSVEELAATACLSVDHFIKLFKRATLVTPMKYLINRRILKAQLMLASESNQVQEIAEAVGYDDKSYFIRLFRKHTGMTPLQYRRSFNNGFE